MIKKLKWQAAKMIKINLNGKIQEFETQEGKLSVQKLVEIRNLKGFFAIELNLKIINKEDYNSTFINDGDSVEIVSFAGGG